MGRAAAALEKWDWTKGTTIHLHIHNLQSSAKIADLPNLPSSVRDHYVTLGQASDRSGPAYRGMRTLLHQARHDLLMNIERPLSVAIAEQKPFDYFDAIRKLIEMARLDILFVDPYLDAEFVARYLPQVHSGVTVRLLTSKRVTALVFAVDLFVQQTPMDVRIRSVTAGLHDRYIYSSIAPIVINLERRSRMGPKNLQRFCRRLPTRLHLYSKRMSKCGVVRKLNVNIED